MPRHDLRNAYPFHNVTQPAPRGYKPQPVKPPHGFARVLLQIIGACAAVSLGVYTLAGFLSGL